MSGRWLLVVIILIGSLAVGVLGSRAQKPAEKPANRENIDAALKLTQAAAAEYEILVDNDKKPLELQREPVLQWSNPIEGEIHGNVFLWMRDGRPLVVASLHKWFSPKTNMAHEFHSLAEEPLSARFHGKPVWKTNEAGLSFVDVPKADVPAAGEAQRLVQLRQFARNFAVTKKNYDRVESELRLLPKPLHSYSAPKHGLVQGALFVFVQGTDPDLFLLIEARGEKLAGTRWQFAVARMTGAAELRLRYRDQQIWKAEMLSRAEYTDPKRVYTNFIFNEIPDFLKGASTKPKE
jgi:hypothetical protein